MLKPALALLALSLAGAVLAAPPKKAPARRPAAPAPLVLSGPIDVLMLEREKRAQLTYTQLDSGPVDYVFDGNGRTTARAVAPPAGPKQAFWQVALDRPRAVDEVDVTFPEGAAHRWSLAAADSVADMQAKRGSYRVLVPARAPTAGSMDQAVFRGPRPYKVYRLDCERTSGEGGAELAAWELWSPQSLAKMEVAAIVPLVGKGSRLPLRVNGTFEAGGRQNLTPEVKWEISPPSRGRIDSLSRFEAAEAGPTRITAVLNGFRSRPLEVQVLPQGQPDWDVTFIERQPRLDYEKTQALTPGQSLVWFAHVKNYGTGDAPSAAFEWRVDGQTTVKGQLPRIERFGQTEVLLTTKWDGQRHDIELAIDPKEEIAESCEGNNRLKVYSDALAVGFWVEDSALQYFHRHQRELNAGSNSWEDWAQRQVDLLNQTMAEASTSGGRGAPERFRLDRLIVVGDGMLPLAGSSPVLTPDARDRSVHLMRGFPAFDPARTAEYRRTGEKSPDNPFFQDRSLILAVQEVRYHELSYRPPIAARAVRRGPQPGDGPGGRVRPFERKMRRPH